MQAEWISCLQRKRRHGEGGCLGCRRAASWHNGELQSVGGSLDDALFDSQIKRWVADCLQEADQKDDPRVVVIGERGVGKSSLINSLRGLKPGAPGAARVGADEVLSKEQLGDGTFYRDTGLIYQDIPGCRGSQMPCAMGNEYIQRFKLDKADACLFVYSNVLNSDTASCAGILKERGVSVYFVRNKVDVDCCNEIDDGNVASEEEALLRMRHRAYNQMANEGLGGVADEAHLFLISAKYSQAVAGEPRFDFQRLKCALESNIRDDAKRAQVKHIFSKNCKALAESRAQECRQLISYYVLASIAAGSIPVPGVSQLGDIAILVKACQHFQYVFCLTEAQLSMTDWASIGAYLTGTLTAAAPFLLAVSSGASFAAEGLAWVPVFGISFSVVLSAGVSGISMWCALTTVLSRLMQIGEKVYALELSGQYRDVAMLESLINDVFPEREL